MGRSSIFPAPIAEATGQFSKFSPPLGIAYLEVIEAILALGIIMTGAGALVLPGKTGNTDEMTAHEG